MSVRRSPRARRDPFAGAESGEKEGERYFFAIKYPQQLERELGSRGGRLSPRRSPVSPQTLFSPQSLLSPQSLPCPVLDYLPAPSSLREGARKVVSVLCLAVCANLPEKRIEAGVPKSGNAPSNLWMKLNAPCPSAKAHPLWADAPR